jgi:putative transposase
MLEVHRTHRAKIRNHSQVADSLDQHGWSASKLWNVANYHSREVWEETAEIPDHEELKDELKTQVQGIAQSVQSARSGGTR